MASAQTQAAMSFRVLPAAATVCFEDALDEAVLVQRVVEVGYRGGPGPEVLRERGVEARHVACCAGGALTADGVAGAGTSVSSGWPDPRTLSPSSIAWRLPLPGVLEVMRSSPSLPEISQRRLSPADTPPR